MLFLTLQSFLFFQKYMTMSIKLQNYTMNLYVCCKMTWKKKHDFDFKKHFAFAFSHKKDIKCPNF